MVVQTLGVACDVTDEASVEAALVTLDRSGPAIGALIDNAGITSPTRFLDVTGDSALRGGGVFGGVAYSTAKAGHSPSPVPSPESLDPTG